MNLPPLALLAQITNAAPAAPLAPDTGLSVLRVIGALLFVLALFFGGVWLFKNWQRFNRRLPGARVARLNILEMKPLGNRQALYVVGYDRQRLLIATSPTNIALLSALPDAEATTAAEPPSPPSFLAAFQQVLNRKA